MNDKLKNCYKTFFLNLSWLEGLRNPQIILLFLIPIFLGFVASWYGLGIFKPWQSRLDAMIFWCGSMMLLFHCSHIIHHFGFRKLARSSRYGALLAAALSGISGIYLYRPLHVLYSHLFSYFLEYSPHPIPNILPPSADILVKWQLDHIPFFIIWVFSIALLYRRTVAAPPPQDKIADFLAGIAQDDLISVSADGHYVRVCTRDQNYRLLYRFSAALTILRPDLGLQIHRSHWINPSYIRQVNGQQPPLSVQLETGETLPISAPYRSQVAALLCPKALHLS